MFIYTDDIAYSTDTAYADLTTVTFSRVIPRTPDESKVTSP